MKSAGMNIDTKYKQFSCFEKLSSFNILYFLSLLIRLVSFYFKSALSIAFVVHILKIVQTTAFM